MILFSQFHAFILLPVILCRMLGPGSEGVARDSDSRPTSKDYDALRQEEEEENDETEAEGEGRKR